MNKSVIQHDLTKDECEHLGQVYRLLGRLWLRELDRDTVAMLKDLQVKLFASLSNVTTEQKLEELAIDYCQLLIGPRDHLPPFQSVWERGELQSEVAESVRKFTDVLRYQPASADNAMRDHLGRQLDIMGFTLTCASDKSATNDHFLDVAQQFFVQHLTWPTSMLAAAKKKANSPFYVELADETARFLSSEANFWQSA